MSFGLSKLSSYISSSKIALTLGVPLTGTLLYHTVKAGAYAGLQCAIEPWKHQTLVDIINLPKALPEFFFQNCRSQLHVTVGSAVLTLVTGALTIYLARSKTHSVEPSLKTRPIPPKQLPLTPHAETLNDIIKELRSKSNSFLTEGLFRLSGSKTTIDAAREAIVKRQEKQVISTLGAHDLTGLIKELLKVGYLEALPAPKFSEQDYIREGSAILDREYLPHLSPLQREMTMLLMQMLLIPIAANKDTTKMDDENLLIAFSRSLFVQPQLPEKATPDQIKEFAIDKNAWLFRALLAYFRAKQE